MQFNDLPSVLGQAMMSMIGALDGWLVVAFVLSLFATAAFRPQQIHDRALFRKSVKLLGFYLVVPIGLGLLLLFGTSPKEASLITQIGLLTGRILLAMSIVQALRSMVPEHTASTGRG